MFVDVESPPHTFWLSKGCVLAMNPASSVWLTTLTLAPKECHVLHLSCISPMCRFKRKSFFNNNDNVFSINTGTLK